MIQAVEIDDHARAIFLELPPSDVVLLQALIESYEGVATVRTIDLKRSLVCVVTTASLLGTTIEVLQGLKPNVRWRAVPPPPQQDYLANDFNYAAKKLRKANNAKDKIT